MNEVFRFSNNHRNFPDYSYIVGLRNNVGKVIQTRVPEEAIVVAPDTNALVDAILEELYNAWFRLVGTVLVLWEGKLYEVPFVTEGPKPGFRRLTKGRDGVYA